MQRDFLAYVRNANGGATKAHFIDDWEPIGAQVWKELSDAQLVYENPAGIILLTMSGALVLRALEKAAEPPTRKRPGPGMGGI